MKKQNLRRALLDAQHELALLIEAINEHQLACERKVSKASWGRANGELYRARLLVERRRLLTIEELKGIVGWSIRETAERLGVSIEEVRRLLRAEELERAELTDRVTEASIRRVEAKRKRTSGPADKRSPDAEDVREAGE